MSYLDKMKIKVEDIIIWILIIAIIAIAICLLTGSPTQESALITIAIFVAGSELLIWRKIFAMDKDTSICLIKFDKSVALNFNELRGDIGGVKDDIRNVKKDIDIIKNRVIKIK